MDYYSIIIRSKNENNTKYLRKLNDFDEVRDTIDKLISERKTYNVNRFKKEMLYQEI